MRNNSDLNHIIMSHGRESSTNFSYMDGVPVKISEKYKPPRRVTLPVGFQHRLSYDAASEEYDFRLERSVLEKMGEWRDLRKAETESRKERIKIHEDSWQKKLSEDLQKFSISSTGGTFENVPAESSGTTSITHSDPRVSSAIPSCLAYPESVPSCSISYTSASLTPTPNESFSNIEVQAGHTNVPSVSTTPSHNVQYSHRTSILTPVPFSQNLNSVNSTKLSSQFNFSDFEADTSSPFDNMELKTINEMEELAHVLQPIANSPDSKEGSVKSDVDIPNNFPSTTSSYSANQSTAHYNTIGAKPAKDSMILTHINGLTGYSSYSTTPRTKERDSRGENYFNAEHNVYDISSNVPVELTNVFSYYPHQTWNTSVNMIHPSAYHAMGNRETQTNVAANISSAGDCLSGEKIGFTDSESGTGLNSTVSFPSTYHQRSGNEEQQQASGRTLSKSVPDIVQELEKELAVKRVAEKNAITNRTSHTPPPRPNSFGSTGLEDWKPWPDLDSPEPTHSKQKRSPAKQAKRVSDLPNPLHELPVNSQKLAKHISEMGFALSRVARACQMFGEDDKKIIEFLLQIQVLEEKKWPGDLAEKALVTNEHNTTEAVRYLEALTQLLDLGFTEDKVSDALVMFHNDRDKALDHLIS